MGADAVPAVLFDPQIHPAVHGNRPNAEKQNTLPQQNVLWGSPLASGGHCFVDMAFGV